MERDRRKASLKSSSSRVAVKKERWLLTRKTWRYMTDAVGNLLPSDHHHNNKLPGTPGSSSSPSDQPHPPTHRSTACGQSAVCVYPEVPPGFLSSSSAHSGVQCHSSVQCVTSESSEGHHHVVLDAEHWFSTACDVQEEFLIWTRTRPPGLDSLSVHEQQGQQGQQEQVDKELESLPPPSQEPAESSSVPKGRQNKSSSGRDDSEVESEGLDRDEYDEYEDETVTQVRKGSLASSISSVISGLSFLRSHSSVAPLSPPPPDHPAGTKDKVKTVSVGVQTEPFPEETLDKLRRLHHKEESLGGLGGREGEEEEEEEGGSRSVARSSVSADVETPAAPLLDEGPAGALRKTEVGAERDSKSGGKGLSGSSSSGYSSSTAPPPSIRPSTSISSSVTTTPTSSSSRSKMEESAYSASISDTVMRYLRMVRKNSKVDKSDMDRFKTVNYDPSLRNIKSKNVTLEEALEHEKKKAQGLGSLSTPPPPPPPPPPPSLEKVCRSVSVERGEPLLEGGKRKEGRVLPSVGIQAGESLVRFLKLFHRRKVAEEVSSPSYCSSQSPLELASPRGSVATTQMSSSGSDNNLDSGSRRGGGSSARASFDTSFDPLDEYDDVFTPPHQAVPQQSQHHPHHHHIHHPPPSSSSHHLSHRLSQHLPHSASWKRKARETDPSRMERWKEMSSGSPTTSSPSIGPMSSQSRTLSNQQINNQHALTSRKTGERGAESKKYEEQSEPVSSRVQLLSLSWDGRPSRWREERECDAWAVSSDSPSCPSPSSSSPLHGELGGGGGGGEVSWIGGSPSSTPPRHRESRSVVASPAGESRRVQASGTSGSELFSGVGSRGSSESHPTIPTAASAKIQSPLSVMQKSKSSSSVLHQPSSASSSSAGGNYSSQTAKLISKSKLWRSKKTAAAAAAAATTTTTVGPNQAKAPASTWTPQGQAGVWTSLLSGRQVILESTNVRRLSALECAALQKVALSKLQAMNLGVDIKIPRPDKTSGASPGTSKPKRRPYLLKKKALSTGFFDSKNREELSKEVASGLVFNIPLQQCLRNDRERRKVTSSSSILPPTSSSPDWPQHQTQSNSPLSVSEDQANKDKQIPSAGSAESLLWTERPHSFPQDSSSSHLPHHPSSSVEDTEWGQVPDLVVACVKHLETYGLHTTGIFRVSSSLKRTRQLREEMDGGKEILLGEEHSPHDVAALLKEFLRDLPEPLLCKELYEAFLRTQKIRNRKLQLECMQSLIQLLPVPNRDTLHALLGLFAKVVDNCQDTRTRTGELIPGNKMEAYSLATLIAPNILPCIPLDSSVGSTAEQSAILTRERRDSIDVVNYLITNYRTLFVLPPDTLNQVYLELLDTNPEAVESILRAKFPAASQEMEDGGDPAENVFEAPTDYSAEDGPKVLLRRREEIVHEGGGKGGMGLKSSGSVSHLNIHTTDLRNESGRGRGSVDVGSREKIDAGADSDSSSTKSTSRWFRKSRSGEQKSRASSDSGSEKVKGGGRKKKEGMEECKRASSLDSVNLMRELGRGPKVPESSSGRSGSGGAESRAQSKDRQRSSSDQGLKIPMDLSRRQSSPLLETSRKSSGEGTGGGGVSGGGVIKASLKIQMPLNIDDTDIPFIEEDNSSEAQTYIPDSVNEPGSSPMMDDLSSTFPYEEVEGRICLGVRPSKDAGSSSSPQVRSKVSTITGRGSSGSSQHNPSSHSAWPSSPRPPASISFSSSSSSGGGVGVGGGGEGSRVSPQAQTLNSFSVSLRDGTVLEGGGSGMCPPTHHPSPNLSKIDVRSFASEAKVGHGKETKGANIGGLIKSKTADFEKLATQAGASGSTLGTPSRVRVLRQREPNPTHVTSFMTSSTTAPATPSSSSSSSSPLETRRRGKEPTVIAMSKSSSDLATSASPGGPTWKRSEIIASPACKKPETFL